MDDEDLPRRRDDAMDALAKQPLDPLSMDELHARIAALESEIARTKAHMAAASAHRSIAEGLFKKG
ncbi:MAG: DUF1192 domain-containing protein [Sphingopyxis sp.]|nr:DUF1192 domain-containing protein [Sphingopyxis sp.]